MVLIVSCTILHEYWADYVRTMQPNLDIILIIKSHICEYSDHWAKQVRAVSYLVKLKHIQQKVDKVQIPQLHQDVEVICRTSNRRQSLKTPQNTLLYLVRGCHSQLIDELLTSPKLFEEALDLVVSAKEVERTGA